MSFVSLTYNQKINGSTAQINIFKFVTDLSFQSSSDWIFDQSSKEFIYKGDGGNYLILYNVNTNTYPDESVTIAVRAGYTIVDDSISQIKLPGINHVSSHCIVRLFKNNPVEFSYITSNGTTAYIDNSLGFSVSIKIFKVG